MELLGIVLQRLSADLPHGTSVCGKRTSSLTLAALPSPTLPTGINPALSLEPAIALPEGDARQDNADISPMPTNCL